MLESYMNGFDSKKWEATSRSGLKLIMTQIFFCAYIVVTGTDGEWFYLAVGGAFFFGAVGSWMVLYAHFNGRAGN